MKYPKINSLFKRDQKTKKLINGEFSCEEFPNIKSWEVREKIDGTNIRITWNNESKEVSFGGRTDDAQIPAQLFDYLKNQFTRESLHECFEESNGLGTFTLFGEGYGEKIQKGGGNYTEGQRFILFDVHYANSATERWLTSEQAFNIANKLHIPMVPLIGIMGIEEIIYFVQSKPKSQCSRVEQTIEGVVCKPCPNMLTRNGDNIIFKLKCKDFD